MVFEATDIKEVGDLKSAVNCKDPLTDGYARLGCKKAKRLSEALGLDFAPAVFQRRKGRSKDTFTVALELNEEIVLSRKRSCLAARCRSGWR